MEALVGLGLALVLGVALSFVLRKGLLAKVVLEEGEEILYQKDRLRLRHKLARGQQLVFRAFVRVTNRRVLLGVGRLSRPRSALVRYCVWLDREDFGGGTLVDGYITFPAQRADVAIVDGAVRIVAAPNAAAFEIPPWIEVDGAEPEILRAAIVDRERPPVEKIADYRR